MSAASTRARALLADRKLYGSSEAWEGKRPGEPGLLATLAGEVKALEDALTVSRYAGSLVGVDGLLAEDARLRAEVERLEAENARLRAALEGAKITGHNRLDADEDHWCRKDDGRARRSACTCGVDAHNARIDAALGG